jgi:hypothetical protein
MNKQTTSTASSVTTTQEIFMRTFLSLVCFIAVSVSAQAADTRIKQPLQKVALASVAAPGPAAAKPARNPAPALSTPDNDSRLNDYRLERESCCGPMN